MVFVVLVAGYVHVYEVSMDLLQRALAYNIGGSWLWFSEVIFSLPPLKTLLIAAGAGGMSASIAPSLVHFVASFQPLVPQRPRNSSFLHISCLSNLVNPVTLIDSVYMQASSYWLQHPSKLLLLMAEISIAISAKWNSWIIAENLVLLKMRGYQYRKKMLSFSHGSPRDCDHLDVLVPRYHHGSGC